jgi:caffeoyl-CoA O-methyltransferase
MNFIDKAVENFAHDHTEPESDLFRRLELETQATMQYPEMMVGRIEGRFLKLLVQLTGARRVLEIGTFSGYSALMMAEGLPPDGRIITCEVNPKAEEIARRYFTESPHGHKIDLRMGAALNTIATLSDTFDLVFIDADKKNYPNYYDACLPLLRPGGLIVADNVLWSGNVLAPKDDDTRAIVAFNERVQSDPRVENVCLTIRDGMMLALKRSN